LISSHYLKISFSPTSLCLRFTPSKIRLLFHAVSTSALFGFILEDYSTPIHRVCVLRDRFNPLLSQSTSPSPFYDVDASQMWRSLIFSLLRLLFPSEFALPSKSPPLKTEFPVALLVNAPVFGLLGLRLDSPVLRFSTNRGPFDQAPFSRNTLEFFVADSSPVKRESQDGSLFPAVNDVFLLLSFECPITRAAFIALVVLRSYDHHPRIFLRLS